ncbi:hypothetical protein C7S18_04105 [Ahniella affigens]|uniref:SbsA Ig-like domain-containing protein n=2 Tax=Ahniella affigens TaxID=2021234 RepID=A0A2P1PNM9_9GAMM|nr:hypothetical protein C7S18_04105 [Ahniella affigens]
MWSKWLAAAALVGTGAVAQAQVIISGGTVNENFDVMAGAQGTTASTVPPGWAFFESGSGANGTYLIDDGTSNSGNTMSYGTAAAADRAFGMLASNSVQSRFGATLQNNTGSALTQLQVQLAVEQWRLGDLNGADTYEFQYCTSTCALSDANPSANWIDFNALDLVSPVTAGTASSILDGNLPANRSALNATITGLNVANGATFMVRWLDSNSAGVDDALAIDDLSFGTGVDVAPTLTSSNPADLATGVAFNANIVLTFSESVTVPVTNSQWFSLTCTPSATDYTAATVVTGSGTNTITLNPATDFAELESCTLNITGAQVTDIDGAPNTLQSDPRVGFTIAEDVAPEVTAINPPFGSNPTTAVDANIDLTFSEAVTTTGSWFTIVCPTSGTRDINNSVVTGTGTSRTINPNVNFANDEICAVTLLANLVEDIDGIADKLGDGVNYESQFRTVLDVAPTVVSTNPANSATNVGTATNIVVTFSEAVTAGTNAFTLSCGAGSLPFALTNTGQTAYTLNPNADLPAATTCNVTVVAANVLDLDGTPTPMGSNFLFSFTTGQSTSNYYASVDASSCSSLRTTLHALIDDHTVYPYTGAPTDVWVMLEAGDQDPANPNNVLDIYFNKSFVKVTDRDNGTNVPQGTRYNREHTWPQSYGFSATNGDLGFPNAPRSDAHHLFASEKDWNADRGNKPFANCPPPGCASRHTLTHPITGGAGSDAACNYASGNCNWVQSPDGNTGSFEVWGRYKGDIARGLMYMDVRYEGGTAGPSSNTPGQAEPDLILTDDRNQIVITSGATAYMGLKTVLRGWHDVDPVDAAEVLRNDVVQSFQNNRNPFVDHPEWACLFDTPCSCGTALPDAVFSNSFE